MINYKKIEMIISDIDGVWTDGSIYRGTDDMEFKKFSVFDGVGVAYARAADLKIAIISARYSPATEFRAKELKIDDCYNGGLNKLHAYSDLKKKYSLSDDQIAYLGDDMVDLPVMDLVGLPITTTSIFGSSKPVVNTAALHIISISPVLNFLMALNLFFHQ